MEISHASASQRSVSPHIIPQKNSYTSASSWSCRGSPELWRWTRYGVRLGIEARGLNSSQGTRYGLLVIMAEFLQSTTTTTASP